ncbi:MAG: hypothetical protein QM775_09055 [Pirellulales bacterium]
MGKKMDKASVIYGGDKPRTLLKDFDHWNELAQVIEEKLGSEAKYDFALAKKLVKETKQNEKFNPKEAYVKVGVVDKDLVLRIKQEKTFGDEEADAIVVKNYVALRKDFEELEQAHQYYLKLYDTAQVTLSDVMSGQQQLLLMLGDVSRAKKSSRSRTRRKIPKG